MSGNAKIWARDGLVHHHIPRMTAQTSAGDVTVTVTVEYRPRNAAWLGLYLIAHAVLAWAFAGPPQGKAR